MNAEITANDGGRFGAYLALPPGGGPAPALVVAIEIRGLNANMRAICDEYAARGYIAVCPDLLWRIEPGLDYDPDTTEDWEKAMAINAAFDKDPSLNPWLADILARMPAKQAAVAMANKLARTIWALLATGATYQADRLKAHS